MIRIFLLFFFFLRFDISSGQTKNLNEVHSENRDSSFSEIHKWMLNKLSLPTLDTFSTKEYYRLWSSRQVLEISQDYYGIYKGSLITLTDEYVPNNETPTFRSFVLSREINIDTVKLIRELILTSSILELPSGDSIIGWVNGFDGIMYCLEQSINKDYSLKTYWTPKAQDSLKEAKQVQEFFDRILRLANAHHLWEEFAKIIPYECFINGGPTIACKVTTNKERRRYQRERRNYRQHGIQRKARH